MMATAALVGISARKSMFSSSFSYNDITDKLLSAHDHISTQYQVATAKNIVIAKKSSNFRPNPTSNRPPKPINALKEQVDTSYFPSTPEVLCRLDERDIDSGYSLEALLLLQKSMLEETWNLSFEQRKRIMSVPREESSKKIQVVCSGISARQRRTSTRIKSANHNSATTIPIKKPFASFVSPELWQKRSSGYVKGVLSEDLLTHSEVVNLSKKIRSGLSLEEYQSRLHEKLGYAPSDEQLANLLRISRTELLAKRIQCSLARDKLAMSNVRLVMSVAQKYDSMGVEMADLVQGGLIGLLHGVEKFDSSKGFKISTYVYWWIRQGVTKVLNENSRTVRLPSHLHERLTLIRNAKLRLQQKGITPTVDKIAECLNMSTQKVRNATEAFIKITSLDREAYPSLNGLPGDTLHSYIADKRLENNPWHGVDERSLQEEVNNLIQTTLKTREQEIIRLYYGLDKEYLTWEDISRRIGLSRERVRQVGLVAFEKLKHAARKRNLEAMLVKH